MLPLVVSALLGPRAEACSPGPCSGGFVVPADGATVPANLPAIVWVPRWGPDHAQGEPALSRGGQPVPLTLRPEDRWSLLAAEGLTPGPHTLTVPASCSAYGPAAQNATAFTFTLAEPAPFPTALGSLAVTSGFEPALQVSTGAGSCSVTLPAAVLDLELRPHPSAAPWMGALLFTTFVDDRPYVTADDLNAELAPGASWRGRGRDRVFTGCDELADWADGALPPGPHRVRMEARLAGHEATWTTPELTLMLECPAPAKASGKAERSGGCVTAPGGPAWLGFAALALLALRARRRP